jgi:hypothetical protein
LLEEVREWQNRPLDAVYPVVFFDALRVKIRDEGLVKNKAVYVALALNPDGEKDVLGLWIEQTEGAKFWLKVVNELEARRVNDILIAMVDGLKGFPEGRLSLVPAARAATQWLCSSAPLPFVARLQLAPSCLQVGNLDRLGVVRHKSERSLASLGVDSPAATAWAIAAAAFTASAAVFISGSAKGM